MSSVENSRKFKALLVSFEYLPYKDGGLARYSYELVNELINIPDLELKLIIAMPKNSKIEIKEKYIEAIEVPFFNNRILCYYIFSFKVYLKIIKNDFKFDVIHILNQISYMLVPLPKQKFIFTDHNTLIRVAHHPHGSSRLDRLLRKYYYTMLSFWEKHLCNAADKIITVSNFTKEDLVQFYYTDPSKIKVIYNGINASKFNIVKQNLHTKKTTLVFVGRLVPRKGIEHLIKATYLIRKKNKNINLYVVGKGELNYELKLKTLVETYNLETNVNFLGFISDEKLNRIYSESDIFVLPSLIEGFGLVLLEAMAHGLPIVASDIGGVNEVVRNGTDGILVAPEDPQKLADAIIQISESDDLYNKFVNNVSDRVGHFSWKKCAEETFDLYKDITNR